jgi:hypothetical protein
LLVTYRQSKTEKYSLYEFDPESRTIGNQLFKDDEHIINDAIEAGMYDRPRKLPSEVDLAVKSGLLLCQDVNHQAPSVENGSVATGIQIVGIDSILGRLDTEPDGSFYLKLMADKPFRIQTIDKDGKVISSCDWISVRPNERRGCVGCHEDPEIVPVNGIPQAVKKAPVKIPMHINKVVEKQVELE